MAHFAQLDSKNFVKRVIVVHNNELLDENGNEVEQKGIDFCRNLLGGTWVQTSYTASTRGCFAGSGHVYDAEQDIFREPTEEELNPPIVIFASSTSNDDDIIVLSNDTSADNDIILSTAGSTANDDEFIVLSNDTSGA